MNSQLQHLTIEQIQEILKRGDFDKFIGINEDEHFEAKSFSPYDLKTGGKKAVMRLVVDIAQLANKHEAYIICGLKCPEKKSIPHDIVESLDLGEKDSFIKMYREAVPSIAAMHIHPTPSSIEVDWYSYSKDPNVGLGVIHIPEQLEERKWFIVDIHGEEAEAVGNTFFGIPVRNGEDKEWKDKKEIYKLTRNSPRDIKDLYNHITDKFQQMEDHLDHLFRKGTGDTKTKLSTLIEEVINDR